MKKINWFRLVASIAICELAGIIGSFFTMDGVRNWLPTLIKPSFNPPNWIFGPVWTLLFLLMGISLYLVWEKKAEIKALIIFGLQLLLNILWSVLFFYMHNPLSAFIEIIVLWILIFLTIIEFYKISKRASYLLIPYLLWVSFAAVLNFTLYSLNK
ncbi:MAG: tryptophan-rich sensory protein [Candidatus Parcubacteria bacterium]|nr:tryptophan-rich sensory protein [Candidatus Parcubacteria bacterium]